MLNSIEHKIGFDTVRQQLKERCLSPLGVAHCNAMAFKTNRNEVIRLLQETAEMLAIINSETGFPIGSINDMTAIIAGLRVEGSFVPTNELIRLRATMTTMADIALFFKKQRDDEGKSAYPRLDSISLNLQTFPTLVAEINRILDNLGNIRDNASERLLEIRRGLSSMTGSINSIIRRVMSRVAKEGLIESDAAPAVRDGRLVIPVSPMNKRRIPGIVHDESASGKTVFIEPAEAVEANNRMRELQLEERREVTHILIETANRLRPYADQLMASIDLLGIFDFIHAKAKFSADNDATLPVIGRNCTMNWRNAFHPILRQSLRKHDKDVVKLDLSLTPENRIVVISGPNAGGKSVTLKTVGIVQYMAQCGVLPTVGEGSQIGIFDNIFIDIGDDQSIEDDLSTYSSHLRNMKTLLQRGDNKTMLLIDEFGAGTEPQIGGAIAQALLRRFNDKGMWGIVTTHFNNLKQFAEDTPGLINGSMLYDRHLMQPLFRLSVGNPGSSFAVEIARKTGLPEDVIADAEQIVGSDYINSDKYLLDINRDKRYWENKRASVKQKEKQLDELIEKYRNDAAELRQQRKEIIDHARNEARTIIESSNAAIERTILDIRRSQAEKAQTLEARQRLADQRQKLSSEDESLSSHKLIDKAERQTKNKRRQPQKSLAPSAESAKTIAVGDNVTLDGSGTVGKVIEISGKNATVIFGNLTTTTKLERLQATNRQIKSSSSSKASSFISVATREDMRERQLNFKQDIDLRGMRVDEALQAVTYFIDDAVQVGSERVRILHGTGTGALRQSIRQYLGSVKAIRSYHDEDVRLGGAGITVVEFYGL